MVRTVNDLLPLKLEEPARFEITAVLLADAMTLYIRMGLKYASAETDMFGRIMLTEIREQGIKTEHHQIPNALKRKDRSSVTGAHNPKVGGSNPSPAIEGD